MCMEDIRLGRRTRGTILSLPITLAGGTFIPADSSRVSLIIQPPPTNRFTISEKDSPAIDVGYTIAPGDHPLELTIDRHGDLVTKKLNGISAVADQNIGVIISTLQEK